VPALLCDHHLYSVHPETAFFDGWITRGRIEENKESWPREPGFLCLNKLEKK